MKAVIPAAGLGTRFLPYTKAQPKEMLPILDKPAIQFVVEEALASGIRDLLIITGRAKRAIEDHFDANPELRRRLQERGQTTALLALDRGLEKARIAYVRQPEPSGNGHAVLCAESAIGGESFAVLFGDDILFGRIPCTASLVKLHNKLGASCIAVQRVGRKQVSAYGMVVGEPVEEGLFRVSRFVEKPSPRQVTSDLVTIGRYVFTPEIFRCLQQLAPGKGKEIWLTDGMRRLLKSEDLYAWVFDGRRFDIGTKLGWLLSNFEIAWAHPAYRRELRRLVGRLARNSPVEPKMRREQRRHEHPVPRA